ncbi:MAG: adenylate/guanylate cyclase domain-containing protein [Candidatus Cloacimonetes bacterium]|nr:adenylate/guanylate cyclase domain-containing protein [Candidatus Cloacimonadota bacterium]
MSYYKLQAVFCIVLCSAYFLVTGISFNVQNKVQIQQQEQLFSSIVKEKKLLLSGIKAPSEEVFANYPKKLTVINIVTNPFIQNLDKILSKKHWKDTLKNISIPFDNQSCLIIGKNGKQQFKTGHSMNDVFDKNWEKSTFIALKNKNTMFHRIEAIYPYKMTIKNFKNYFQKFQVTHQKNNQFVYRYYTKIGKYQVFYFLRLNNIHAPDLHEAILKFFSNNDPSIIPSVKDQIVWNTDLPSPNTLTGLTGLSYLAIKDTFLEYLQSLKYFNLLFLISFFLLYYFGGYRIIALNFQFKFLFLYLLFIYILSLTFVQSFEVLKVKKQEILKRELSSQWNNELKKLEKEFLLFKMQLAKELLDDFDKNQLFKSKYWSQDIFGLHSKRGYSKLSHKKMDHNNYTVLTRYMPYLAGKQPEFEVKTKKIKDIVKYLNINQQSHKIVISDMFTSNNNHHSIEDGGRIFSKLSQRVFKSITIMKESVELLFATKGKNESFEAIIVKTSLDTMQSTFFKQINPSDFTQKLVIKSQRNVEDFYKLAEDNDISTQEFEGYKNRFINVKGSLFEFRRDNQKYFGKHIKSNIFQYYDLLFITPKSNVYTVIDQMQQKLHYFLWFFYLSVLLISYILTRIILKPIASLKEGLLQINNNNLNIKLDVQTKDERGQILHRFNSMVTELQRKEKMLPFISNAVFKLLTTGSGKIETKYTGKAVVLFSDIKSFTSISETRDPQEVVDMLNDYFSIWQEKIERNGGIVDRFIGDAISVVYFEKSSPHFVQQAIQTSVEVMEALEKFNEKRKAAGEFIIENGVGLCYGEVYFSMVGDQNKMEFLIQGTPVALSEYLEGQSRYSNHSHIILDPYIKDQVNYQYDFAPFEVEDKDLGTFYELVL